MAIWCLCRQANLSPCDLRHALVFNRFFLSQLGWMPLLLLRICCSPQTRGDLGCLLLTIAFPMPFHLRLIDTDYRPSDDVEPHRFNSEPFSSGGSTQHPLGSTFASRIVNAEKTVSVSVPSASPKGGGWHTNQAENAVSRSHFAWLLRRPSFSGHPG